MPSLRRESDGAGDSGAYSVAFGLNEDGTDVIEKGNRPMVGCIIRVGSVTDRSYSGQDYWTTTLITEIIEDTGNYVRFKTSNSIYVWKV